MRRAASATDRLYCLLEGRVSLQGKTSDLDQEALARAYFGAEVSAPHQREQAQ